MENTQYTIGTIISGCGTLFTFLFGTWEIGLITLITCMSLDLLLGLLCGAKNKELSSQRGFIGLKKKFTVIIILILAVLLDRLFGQCWIFRTIVIYFYIAVEGISILENATILGVTFPEKIKDVLVQFRDSNKKDINK